MNAPLPAGIHRIPMAAYLADPCGVPSLNSGTAHRLIVETPMHAYHQHPRLGGRPSEYTKASDIGTVSHDMLLGGEGKICSIERSDYRSAPTKENPDGAIPIGWTNNAIKAARDKARANGLTPILAEEYGAAKRMADAARAFIAYSEIADVFDAGESELTVIAQEGKTFLRTRPDWLNLDAGISLSFKTTQAKVEPEAFDRMARSMGYWFSTAFYERCLSSAGHPGVRHYVLAQEQTFPYACSLFRLSPDKFALELDRVNDAIELWGQCMESGRWPGYSGRAHVIEAKPWELEGGEVEVSWAGSKA
ncbi:MAG TPA: PD-(D/E)XK nuclease-like domain-containing protein [Roseateles sp.]|nr:PD-(D/E)XK nuclease-like domain-containing protein [Roseateles sp.]